MKFNKYLPFVLVYFFINTVALPYGLTYTALLAPIFYSWILLTRKKEILLPFIVLLSPFILIQVLNPEVVRRDYFVSLLNVLLVYVSCQAVYSFLIMCSDIENIFRKILIINFVLCLVALVFYFTPYYSLFWIEQNISESISHIRRLRMFTYEASYYALLFVPVFVYYFFQYFFRQNEIKGVLLLSMMILPLILSFSIGVIGALFIAITLTFFIHFSKLIRKKRVLNFLITSTTIIAVVWPLMFFWQDNPFVKRLENIFLGIDVSGRGRTVDAYVIAEKMLEQRDHWWGIGLGQVKILGADIIREYYLYYTDKTTAIPNAMAETWAIFGWVGVILRISIELFLFYFTRVWSNYYRLLLFLFIFIYQFTGSFITNIAEYVIWILAFTNVFRQFDTQPGDHHGDLEKT